ncbi:hypothetical protein TIFTF001_028620 [Ficus carica]|uniref:Uncharacterized protein n=1 Tax=Ficus carica TaxID=3494 RepID=A0AA88DQB4_FICCA|nr:hypothetical protein TIFTF001_028620 [Ficus carica]
MPVRPAGLASLLAGADRVFRTGLTGIGQVGQENKCLLVFRTDLTGLGHAGQENQRALGMIGPDRVFRIGLTGPGQAGPIWTEFSGPVPVSSVRKSKRKMSEIVIYFQYDGEWKEKDDGSYEWCRRNKEIKSIILLDDSDKVKYSEVIDCIFKRLHVDQKNFCKTTQRRSMLYVELMKKVEDGLEVEGDGGCNMENDGNIRDEFFNVNMEPQNYNNIKWWPIKPVQKTRSGSDRPNRGRPSRSGKHGSDRTGLTGTGQAGQENTARIGPADRDRSSRSGKPAPAPPAQREPAHASASSHTPASTANPAPARPYTPGQPARVQRPPAHAIARSAPTRPTSARAKRPPPPPAPARRTSARAPPAHSQRPPAGHHIINQRASALVRTGLTGPGQAGPENQRAILLASPPDQPYLSWSGRSVKPASNFARWPVGPAGPVPVRSVRKNR